MAPAFQTRTEEPAEVGFSLPKDESLKNSQNWPGQWNRFSDAAGEGNFLGLVSTWLVGLEVGNPQNHCQVGFFFQAVFAICANIP